MKRKLLITVITIVLVFGSITMSYAATNVVTSSNIYTATGLITATDAGVHPAWTKGYVKGKAYGYVTSNTSHYANAELLLFGQHVKYSGRKWGTGIVSANTNWGYSVCAIIGDYYGGIIYYGF